MLINKYKIATPISDLILNDFSSEIIKNSDCFETRDHTINSKHENQELFHCELQPIHTFDEKKISYLKKIKREKPNLKLISFHLASCYKSPKILNKKFYPSGDKISKNILLNNAEKNLNMVKNIFGEKIKIAVENNNFYKTEAYDIITEPDFITQIVNKNNIYFLLDLAHAQITAYNKKISLSNYLNELPLNKMVQIHIAKPGFDESGEIFDSHELPSNLEFKKVKELLLKYPNTKYLTIEFYKDRYHLNKSLKELRKKIIALDG